MVALFRHNKRRGALILTPSCSSRERNSRANSTAPGVSPCTQSFRRAPRRRGLRPSAPCLCGTSAARAPRLLLGHEAMHPAACVEPAIRHLDNYDRQKFHARFAISLFPLLVHRAIRWRKQNQRGINCQDCVCNGFCHFLVSHRHVIQCAVRLHMPRPCSRCERKGIEGADLIDQLRE